jgi:hypothetical protein
LRSQKPRRDDCQRAHENNGHGKRRIEEDDGSHFLLAIAVRIAINEPVQILVVPGNKNDVDPPESVQDRNHGEDAERQSAARYEPDESRDDGPQHETGDGECFDRVHSSFAIIADVRYDA